jgi:hypothetical protein
MDRIANATPTLAARPAIIGSSSGNPRRDVAVLGAIRNEKETWIPRIAVPN